MADQSFSVDTEGLSEQIPYVQEFAARIRGIGTGLQTTLASLGDCWGDDETGQQFLGQYADPRDQIIGGLHDTGDVVDSTADGVRTMATNYERLEDENIAAVRQLNTGGSTSSGERESRAGDE